MAEFKGKAVYDFPQFAELDFDELVGEYCAGTVVGFYAELMPPRMLDGSTVQVGEAMAYRWDDQRGTYRETYPTFKLEKNSEDGSWGRDAVWVYCGDCFAGETAQRGGRLPSQCELVKRAEKKRNEAER